MIRYEYKIEVIPYIGIEDRVAYLNKLGLEGWLCFDAKHSATESIFMFARALP